jgi:hypothetical protein
MDYGWIIKDIVQTYDLHEFQQFKKKITYSLYLV